jgi:hypothetical protein
MLVAEHLVATTRGRDRTLVEPERAAWLWARVQATMGAVLSFVLMPDHLHLVTAPGLRDRLVRVLAGFTALTGVRFDVLVPEPAHSRSTAGRMMRYGFYNPVRDRLVDDPWSWPWSTLRDLGGAAYPIWTSRDHVAAALGRRPEVALRSLTTVANQRAAAPTPRAGLIASFDGVKAAVASALRIRPADVAAHVLGRRLVVQACEAVAAVPALRVCEALGCSVRTVSRLRTPRHAALDPVLLCLGDARLLAVDRVTEREPLLVRARW